MDIKKIGKVVCGVLTVNPPALYSNLRGIPAFFRDWKEVKKQTREGTDFPLRMSCPCLGDRYASAGMMAKHYFQQDLYVARRIFRASPPPVRHVDIGSLISGFVAHVAVFREVELLDIRGLQKKVDGVRFRCADLMQLPGDLENYCDSISSLHAIEHFGLGRYGDPIDVNGHVKALQSITKMLQSRGVFYFSVPIGPQRIEFNGHRVFAVKYLLALLEKDYDLLRFSYEDDAADFHENATLTEKAVAENFGCRFGCGIFELQKRQ
jgi:SAM-dependent methyltransferase